MDIELAEKHLGKWLIKAQTFLDDEDYCEAKHFLDHGEWEMAFEIILVGAIEKDIHLSTSQSEELLLLAEESGIRDNGGIFDYDIFEKMTKWLNKGQK